MCEHAQELIETENAKIVLDLSKVMLADRDAAMFLAVCRFKGIVLRTCPAFLREWVAKEQAQIAPWLCRSCVRIECRLAATVRDYFKTRDVYKWEKTNERDIRGNGSLDTRRASSSGTVSR
jgi:hypothetical protein